MIQSTYVRQISEYSLYKFLKRQDNKIISEGHSTFKTLSEFLIVWICNLNNVGCSIPNGTYRFYIITFGLVENLVNNDEIIYGI